MWLVIAFYEGWRILDQFYLRKLLLRPLVSRLVKVVQCKPSVGVIDQQLGSSLLIQRVELDFLDLEFFVLGLLCVARTGP